MPKEKIQQTDSPKIVFSTDGTSQQETEEMVALEPGPNPPDSESFADVNFSDLPPIESEDFSTGNKRSFAGQGNIFSGRFARLAEAEGEGGGAAVPVETTSPLVDQVAPVDSVASVDKANLVRQFLDNIKEQEELVPQESPSTNILRLLPEQYHVQIEQMARSRGVSSDEIVAAILSSIGERGELGDMQLNPRWSEMLQHMNQVSRSGSSQLLQSSRGRSAMSVICKGCDHAFPLPAGRYSQDYCCDNCGLNSNPTYASSSRKPHSADCKTDAAEVIRKLTSPQKKPLTVAQAQRVA